MLADRCTPLVALAPSGFSPGLLAGIDAGLAVRTDTRPKSIADWRPHLQGTSVPPDQAVTQRLEEPSRARRGLDVTALAPTARRGRRILWAGAALALAGVASGGYALLGAGSVVLFNQPLQSLTAEQLEQALAERRKADAAATEKKRLEEEAQRQAAADAEAKRQADEELAKAQQQRQQAEAELAKLKAEIEARREAEAVQREQAAAAKRAVEEAEQKNRAEAEIAALRKAEEEARKLAAAEAAAKRAADEEAQRKAEAEAAALRKAEEEAQKKALAEAEAKRLADEALAKAQAERQRADEEAARQKIEVEARQKAEAAAKSKADADAQVAAARKAGETAENGLRLSTQDRQRLQVALTSLGFDTRRSDGTFGPRSREMISAWSRALAPTGFLDASQMTMLLGQAADAVGKYDSERARLSQQPAAKPTTAAPPPSANQPGSFLDRFSTGR
jgi:hypothetical protein